MKHGRSLALRRLIRHSEVRKGEATAILLDTVGVRASRQEFSKNTELPTCAHECESVVTQERSCDSSPFNIWKAHGTGQEAQMVHTCLLNKLDSDEAW